MSGLSTSQQTISRDWITIPEAAERLSVSDKTIRRLIASGSIPASRFGKRLIRIDAAALIGTPLGVR